MVSALGCFGQGGKDSYDKEAARLDSICETGTRQVDTVLYKIRGASDTVAYRCALRFTPQGRLVSCVTRFFGDQVAFYIEGDILKRAEWFDEAGDMYTCNFRREASKGACLNYQAFATTLLSPWVLSF